MNSRVLLAGAAVVVALAVVSATVLAGLFVLAPMVLADRHSHYDYEFHIEATDDLTGVTLYLPAPVGPDGLMEGRVVVSDDDGARVANTSSFVDTEHGQMLAVELDRIEGSLEYMLLSFDDEGNLTGREVVSPDELPENMTNKQATPMTPRYTVHVFYEYRDGGDPIDTQAPTDSEPTLSPKYDLVQASCEPPYSGDEDRCYEFATMAYAEYDAAPDTSVTLSGEFSGWNEWGWGLSNSYNSFTERVERTDLRGPQADWVVLPADLHAGEGSYPTRGN